VTYKTAKIISSLEGPWI